MQSTLSRPYVVTVIPETPREATPVTVSDLLLGSVGMAGVMLSVALVLGLVLAGVRIAIRRAFPQVADHMPSVNLLDAGAPLPPTSPRQ